VAFRALHRVAYLLVVGFVWSSCALNNPLAIASPWPRVESGDNFAPKKVTVENVQRILAEDKRKSDAEVARQLSSLELTERMSYARLKSLKQSVPGAKSRSALVALADASEFLGPAAADVLSQAPPDLNEQRRMIALIVEYLRKTLPKLPNFYATRTTVRYESDVRRARGAKAGSQNDSSWRKIGSSTVVVTYRDGKEVVDPREWAKHSSHMEEQGLITRGTFGPILATVISDACARRDGVGPLGARKHRNAGGVSL